MSQPVSSGIRTSTSPTARLILGKEECRQVLFWLSNGGVDGGVDHLHDPLLQVADVCVHDPGGGRKGIGEVKFGDYMKLSSYIVAHSPLLCIFSLP